MPNPYALHPKQPGRTRRARAVSVAIPSPQAARSPEPFACSHATAEPSSQLRPPQAKPARSYDRHEPVVAFVVRRRGVTSPAMERTATALQRTPPGLPPGSLLATHSHSAAFESPGRPEPGTENHPGGYRASRISDRCRSLGHVARPYVPAFPLPYAQGSHPAAVSVPTGRDDFSLRKQKLGLPKARGFRGSAPSPNDLTSKRFPAFHR
jgi:hypothetical protein